MGKKTPKGGAAKKDLTPDEIEKEIEKLQELQKQLLPIDEEEDDTTAKGKSGKIW